MGIVLQAPAKINLYLGVHKQKDARGYHRVDSLMVAIGLADEVHVEKANALSVACEPAVDVPQEHNTAFRAAQLLAQSFGLDPRVRITITKNIPAQSGMGGSSSDAAAVLVALCHLWQIDQNDKKVMAVARAVGADVPFFLDPRPTLLKGAGDVPCETFPSLEGVPIVVVREKGPGVSTKEAYEEFDRIGKAPQGLDKITGAMREGHTAAVAANLANNLDPIACELSPEIKEVKRWLRQQPGVLATQVTGSGSAVFAICETLAAALAAKLRCAERPSWWACATTMQ